MIHAPLLRDKHKLVLAAGKQQYENRTAINFVKLVSIIASFEQEKRQRIIAIAFLGDSAFKTLIIENPMLR